MKGQTETPPSSAYPFFAALIPDLAARSGEFVVDVDVIDDESRALFAEQIRGLVTDLPDACDHHDAGRVREHAHSLEGTGGTLGYPEISIVGWELSVAVKTGDWTRCASLSAQLGLWSKTLG
jgi:hypothetical protein